MNLFPDRKNFYLIIFLISVTSMLFALYVEFVLEYKPCKLCIYQRIPYLAAIFISFIGFNYSNNDQILIVTIMIFALSAILSGYHFGIENSIFDELSVCTNGASDISNKSKLLDSLSKTMPTNCKDVTFKIFGVSLAAINTILSFLIVIFSIRTLTYEKN